MLVDGNGDEDGRILYDSFGMVMENTLTAELTGALLDVPDAATGLVHLGDGRWYDPALGRPLQPNPAGSPPTVPQALNRYAATLLGQPGVAQAAQGDAFNWTPHAVGFAKNTAVELARNISVVKGYTYTGVQSVRVRGSYETLTQHLPDSLQQFPGILLGEGTGGNLDYYYLTLIQVEIDEQVGIKVSAQRAARELTENLPEGSLVTLGHGRDGYARTAADTIPGKLDDVINLNYIGFGLDVVIGSAFQFGQDFGNPYLSNGQIAGRLVVSGLGGAFTSAASVSIFCGPGAPVCAVVAGVGGGIVWSQWLQPIVFQAFNLSPSDRNLKPLYRP